MTDDPQVNSHLQRSIASHSICTCNTKPGEPTTTTSTDKVTTRSTPETHSQENLQHLHHPRTPVTQSQGSLRQQPAQTRQITGSTHKARKTYSDYHPRTAVEQSQGNLQPPPTQTRQPLDFHLYHKARKIYSDHHARTAVAQSQDKLQRPPSKNSCSTKPGKPAAIKPSENRQPLDLHLKHIAMETYSDHHPRTAVEQSQGNLQRLNHPRTDNH